MLALTTGRNKGLLSFDGEGEEEPAAPVKAKMLSAHDVLDDPNLSKEVKDDRGFSAALPEALAKMPSAVRPKPKADDRREEVEKARKKRKVEDAPQASEPTAAWV